MGDKFRFSVVIPVYNVYEYLRETLDSLINQDIGFEKYIQIILVNDGSTDKTGEICREYKERYPENIIYVEQENGGASAARNHGMEYIEGKYVNFLNSGNKWAKNSFRVVYDFFEKRYDKIDLVACPQKFPKAGDEYHRQIFKYENGSRVIDVLDKYQCIQLHVTASFVKAEVLQNHRFDERLTFAEESKFVNSVILDKLKYGVVAEALHLYHKGGDVSSAIQGRGTSKEWYLDTPKYYYLELIKESINKYDTVILYIQYLILYDFQWRLREDLTKVLTVEEQGRYEDCLNEMLSYMDDDVICHLDKMYVEYKIYALSLKYGYDITEKLKYRKGFLYFNNIRLYSMQAKSLFSVDVLDIRDGMLHLSGRIWCPFSEDIHFYVESDRGERTEINSTPADFRKSVIFGKEIIRVRGYEVALPLSGVREYNVYGCYKNRRPQKLYIRFGKFSHLSQEVKELYYQDGGYLIGYDESAGLLIRKKNLLVHMGKELRLLLRCMRDKKYGIAGYRVLSQLIRPFLRKERWIVMERINVAGDNAEHFYKYLKEQEENDIKSFFTISEDSVDYEKMKRVGKVLPFRKFRYKLNVLLAKNIISSQGEDNIFNPWDNDSVYIRDLYQYHFVFLQHGIIKDDLSEWLNKFNKNLQMFVTSAKPEYQSILEGDYFYDETVVKLTGLPRYDNLRQDVPPEKSIIFMPTWRHSLASRLNNDTGERSYNPLFKHSQFFQFYNSLINDERLLSVLRKNGYTGKFFLHTHHKVQTGDFTDNDTIKVISDGIDYQEEFQRNALLITDFSSVAFDFAYLKKPVIYTHFDIDTFFEGQVYSKGYFEYDRDGLGVVCYDYETTLQAIINAVESGCKLEPIYDERGNRFYRWFDNDNCRRVYEAIRSLP